jgi:hypothetical protein
MEHNIEGDCTMNDLWNEISKDWPDPTRLKDVEKLPGFPYSKGYFRNLVTGQTSEKELKAAVFRIGKFPAIRKNDLVRWLAERTA